MQSRAEYKRNQSCNLLLGHAKDNLEILESAIDYLLLEGT
jgi:hypothetical protein